MKRRPRTGTARRFGRSVAWIATAVVLWLAITVGVTAVVPPVAAVGFDGPARELCAARFLADDSWQDASGERQLEQSIFDALFERIDAARRLVYLDLFLFNDWQGPVPETHRALADELAARLIGAAQRPEAPAVILVTDPLNTVYGGLAPARLAELRDAGVSVVLTDLTVLQDSNPAWSSVWRWLIRPFGNRAGATTLPNPLGEGRVSVRSWLALLNFKANHRKLAVFDVADTDADACGGWRTLVTSANPHDGSSAHRNVALEAGGAVVGDVLAAERGLLQAIGAHAALERLDRIEGLPRLQAAAASPAPGKPSVRLINESAIRDSLRRAIESTDAGDAIALEMFYLAERSLVTALAGAAERGVQVRLLLDVNSDAFGRAKNGVPNRPVAAELVAAGAQVRWCATLGEQCHAKWVHVRRGATHRVWLGSGNLTRRNLDDFNLESNLLVQADDAFPALQAMLDRFEAMWHNDAQRTYSVAYDTHSDDSAPLRWQYRFMEGTGLGTF